MESLLKEAPVNEPVSILDRPALTDAEQDVLGKLFRSWPRFAQMEHLVTPISPLALRLIAFNPEAQQASAEIVQIVESDPVLTARVLGLANAASFGNAGKLIFEVKTAVLRLGLNTTTRVALAQLASVWMRKAVQVPDRALLRSLWFEYLVTAFAAHEIAWVLGDTQVSPNVCYAGGLLHDIGTLALCGAAPELMTRFILSGYCIGTPLHQEFVEAHTRLGETLLSRCGAPATLCEIAGRHHAGFSQEESATSIVVFLADHLHRGILSRIPGQFAIPDEHPLGCFGDPDAVVDETVESLGLVVSLDQIMDNVAGESARIEALAGDFG